MKVLAMDILLIVLLAGTMILAAVYDFRFQRIPNLLTYPAMFCGLVYYGAAKGAEGLVFSAEGLAVGIAILIVPYLLGGMGAGDVKLMGVAGAMTGPRGVFVCFLYTAIVGGVYALILMAFRLEWSKRMLLRSASTLRTFAYTGHFILIPDSETENKPKLCYGVAIALGSVIYIMESMGFNFLL
jgi:prepilin peptidase CpaA